MDHKKFDELTRKLSTASARRSIVKSGAAMTVGALVGVVRHETTLAGCKGKNGSCDKDNDCCSKACGGNGKCKCSKTGKGCKKDGDCCKNSDQCQNKKCQSGS